MSQMMKKTLDCLMIRHFCCLVASSSSFFFFLSFIIIVPGGHSEGETAVHCGALEAVEKLRPRRHKAHWRSELGVGAASTYCPAGHELVGLQAVPPDTSIKLVVPVHAEQMRSEDEVGGVVWADPALHVVSGVHEASEFDERGMKLPVGHGEHWRLFEVVGATAAKEPALQVVTARQVDWPVRSW